MKRILPLLLAFAAMPMLHAASRSASQALVVAQQFVNQHHAPHATAQLPAASLQLAYEARNASGAADYYVFNRSTDGGFVIVGGDDATLPVWGYAESGTFDADALPDNMRWWLEEYQRQLQWLHEHHKAAPRRAVAIDTAVEPLLRTLWNQCKPYNDMCPKVSYSSGMLAYGNHAPSGCVATAVAQIMNYYQWPARGNGTHSYSCRVTYDKNWQGYTTTLSANFSESVYDWDNMADIYYFLNDDYNTVYARSADGEGSIATRAQQNAVAKLMSDLGVALEMSYGTKGSGAMSEDVPDALATYFHYTRGGYLMRDYYVGDWDACLRRELDEARPLYYSGQANNGGHAFVLDGYDTEGYFHVNWGWGGRSNGYFISSLLSPSDQGVGSFEGGYNTGQGTIVRLRPATGTRLILSPVYIDFGTVQPGRSATQSVDLGGEEITDVVTATLTGDDADCFVLARDTYTPDEVMHGIPVSVTYTPKGTDKDKHTATLTVQGGGWDQTISIPLTGRVNVASFITATPDSLDFGTVALGSTTKQAVALSGVNMKSDVTLTLSGEGAASYRLSNTTVSKASMSRGTNIVVFFTPTVAGSHNALLTITGGGASQPATISLTGWVEPEPALPGDVNGDGQVDIDDVNAIINIILEFKSPADYSGNANVDGDADGMVDIDDVNALINIILKQ
ncbi:MAG: C10 family peptidase [Muribaculaceae bacterium]|nr:C10 family peptidase [Muribaculaceae bacterium]